MPFPGKEAPVRIPAPPVGSRRAASPPPRRTTPGAALLALQRRAGNAAVTGLLSAGRAGGATTAPHRDGDGVPTIQRTLARDSDPRLADLYMEMFDESANFEEFEQRLSRGRPLLLVDSSRAGPDVSPAEVNTVDYNYARHRIRIPARRMHDSAVRKHLLFEMHNAVAAPRHGRTERFAHSFTPEESHRLARYVRAAMALAIEWDEWTVAAEFHVRRESVDEDMGRGTVAPSPTTAANFAEPGRGWFLFENCLADQRRFGHTRHYDPAEAMPGWAGETLLAIALERSPGSMRINRREFDEFRAGLRTSVKNAGNNPFKSRDIVRRAAQQDGEPAAP